MKTTITKRMTALFMLICFGSIPATFTSLLAQNCMMRPVSLQQRIQHATLVIEGEVVSARSFWNTEKTMIYTQYTVKICKSFKGFTESPVISIINEGGQIGDDLIVLNPNLELAVGDAGIFDLVEFTNETNLPVTGKAYAAWAGAQSFIRYHKNQDLIQGVYDKYTDAEKLYSDINIITHINYSEFTAFNAREFLQKKTNTLKNMVISSVAPLTVTAGTYTEITISGSGFGTTPTRIWFHDANNTPNGIISPPAACNQIISWSDTQIKTYVPTQATGGTLFIEDSAGGYHESSQALNVVYNITNMYLSGDGGVTYKSFTFDLVNKNSEGGYTWTYGTNFYSNVNARARFEVGLDLWRCATGVNWKTNGAATTSVSQSLADGINVIGFDDGSPLPAGVLGRASSYYESCLSGGVTYRTLKEFDIFFNHTINWNFLSSNPGPAQYDFQSVATHEIGHIVQQGHYSDIGNVMHWALDSGMTARVIRPAFEVTGADYIMSRNNAAELAVTGSTGGSTITNPCGPGEMTLNFTNCGGSSITAYPENTVVNIAPNPFAETAIFSYSSPPDEMLRLELYNVQGLPVLTISNIRGGSCIINREKLPAGLYLYKLSSDTKIIGTGKLIAE